MVCHMDKSPLVEVLGSFTSYVVVRKFMRKYWVMGYVTGVCVDAGMRSSMNFSHEKVYHEISWNLLVMVLLCPCSQEIIF